MTNICEFYAHLSTSTGARALTMFCHRKYFLPFSLHIINLLYLNVDCRLLFHPHQAYLYERMAHRALEKTVCGSRGLSRCLMTNPTHLEELRSFSLLLYNFSLFLVSHKRKNGDDSLGAQKENARLDAISQSDEKGFHVRKGIEVENIGVDVADGTGTSTLCARSSL